MAVGDRSKNSLAALTAAALVLPGVSTEAQAFDKQAKVIKFQHASYLEDDLSGKLTSSGEESPRYQIQVDQLQLLSPLNDDYYLSLNVLTEEMSGASPMSTTIGRDNKSRLNMSGASIDESRKAVSGKITHLARENGTLSGVFGLSVENDYKALSLGVEGERFLDDKQKSLTWGLGLSFDSLKPTQDGLHVRPNSENKKSFIAYSGITQVINSGAQFQSGLSLSYLNGYLSDPYKILDHRPDKRVQVAWANKLRYYLSRWESAVHLDYRFHFDDWGITSHTASLGFYYPIDENVIISPSIRYYTQSQANFYSVFDDNSIEGEQSSDFRLSPYGAFTTGIKMIMTSGQWKTTIAAEFYNSSGDYAINKVRLAHAGLVSYSLYTLGFDYSF